MEQAYKLHGDVLTEHGVTKDETVGTDRKGFSSPEKMEETIV